MGFKPRGGGVCMRLRCAGTVMMVTALLCASPCQAQQKTGPGLSGTDSLTWQGITLYGVVDVGVQYDTHSAPFTPYRPAASGNIVRANDYGSAVGLTPSNIGQSRVGLQGIEPLSDELAVMAQVETFFNPQSGQLADSLRSLAEDNGKPVSSQRIGVDGSSAGQVFQTAFVGVRSAHFGTVTLGRQLTLLAEGTVKYDPNYNATAFGLLGASNTYSGGGTSEGNRLNTTVEYSVGFAERVHLAALYKFNGSRGGANTAVQANLGAEYQAVALDAYYSKLNSAITAAPLSAAQVVQLPALGLSPSDSLAGTISDDTTYSLMALYRGTPLKVFAGYMYLQYANPRHALGAGYDDIGGYVLAFVTNNAYTQNKVVQVYWTGARYTLMPNLDVVLAYYGYHQSAYGTGAQAGCSSAAHPVCSGRLDAFSVDADYHFNGHFDAYLGAMYSGVHDGAASGYLYSTDINPTLGIRYKF